VKLNRKYVASVGQSTGFACAYDWTQVQSVGELMNSLTVDHMPQKTICYSVTWTDRENFAISAAGL